MARVSKEKLTQLEAWFDEQMPDDLAYKCTLCNETLTHLTKKAEAEVGVGTATVTKMLAERINEHALEHEQVSGSQLRDRVRYKEGEVKWGNSPNKPTDEDHNPCADIYDEYSGGLTSEDAPEPEWPTWTCTECGGTFTMSQTTCNCAGSQPQQEPPKERKETPPRQDPPLRKRYGNSAIEKEVAEEGMRILKRHLAKKFHPDAGGSDDHQQVVNYLIDEYKKYFIVNAEKFAGSYASNF